MGSIYVTDEFKSQEKVHKLLNSHSNECHLLYFQVDPNKIGRFIHGRKKECRVSQTESFNKWNVSSRKKARSDDERIFLDLNEIKTVEKKICVNKIAIWSASFGYSLRFSLANALLCQMQTSATFQKKGRMD